MYKEVIKLVEKMGIEVEILQADEHQLQRITIETDGVSSMVDSLNRGGGRLVLRDARPSYEKAVDIANELGIVLVKNE
jgi:L-serine dehydratase